MRRLATPMRRMGLQALAPQSSTMPLFGKGCMRGIERLFAGHIPRLAVEHQIGAVN